MTSGPTLVTTGLPASLGTFNPFAGDTLLLIGGEALTFKNGMTDVTGAFVNYSIDGGAFSSISLTFNENNVNGAGGDQRWANTDFTIDLLAGQAVEEVTRLGYRRVGLCIHPEIEDVVEHRFLGGFLAGQSRLLKEDRVPPCPFEYGDKKTFQQWVRQHRPDVILTLHHQIREWLEAMKLRVPDDIGLAHLDHVAG